MKSFGEFLFECGSMFYDRKNIYRNAYEYMPEQAILFFIVGKAYRVKALLKAGGSREKILDDLKDIVNYCYILYMKKNGKSSFSEFASDVRAAFKNEEKTNTDVVELADSFVEKVTEYACEEKFPIGDVVYQTYKMYVSVEEV